MAFRNGKDPDGVRVRDTTVNHVPNDDEDDDDDENDKRRWRIPWWLIILLLIIAFFVTSYCTGWTNQWSKGLHDAFPNIDFSWLNNPAYEETKTETVTKTAIVAPTATAAPTATPKPTAVPTVSNPTTPPEVSQPTAPPAAALTEPPAPTEPPAQVVAAEAEPVQVTAAPVHGVFTLNGEIHVTVNGEEVVLRKFTYAGGYIPADDPWYSTIAKEAEGAYGPPIYGKTPQELTYNWLRELCKSPHQIIRLRTQMSLISPKSLEEEDRLAAELAALPAINYDAVVNETLDFFFTHLDGGRIESSTDWGLENYMSQADASGINLHGRTNADDDTDPENKDVLLTFYARGASKTFVSSDRGFYNTLNSAKKSKKNYSQRAWVNMTEGGTWKWKPKGSSGGSSNPPSNTTAPPTSSPAPTNTPRPTKDPEQRPTVSDAPVGGGSTDPDHATDEKTTSAPTSTPAPENTATPAPTTAPTAVPTAVVRPTEKCDTTDAPLIREDTATQPPAEEHHNVPTQEPRTVNDGNNTGDFDPDSI